MGKKKKWFIHSNYVCLSNRHLQRWLQWTNMGSNVKGNVQYYSTTPQDQTDCVEEMSQCIDNQLNRHIIFYRRQIALHKRMCTHKSQFYKVMTLIFSSQVDTHFQFLFLLWCFRSRIKLSTWTHLTFTERVTQKWILSCQFLRYTCLKIITVMKAMVFRCFRDVLIEVKSFWRLQFGMLFNCIVLHWEVFVTFHSTHTSVIIAKY